MSRAAKKADRIAAEGVVEVLVSSDATAAVAREVNCETDFVAKNEEFRQMVREVAHVALSKNINDDARLG
jgi:elongation factor Ts